MSFAPAEKVVLRHPDLGALPATVQADDDETITLVLAVRVNGSARALRGHATVEGTTRRGLRRVHGVVAAEPQRPELVRLRREGDHELLQRRERVRVDAVMPVTVTPLDPPAPPFATTTRNLSVIGALIHDVRSLPLGTPVELALALDPASALVVVRGEVVRDAGGDEKGITFEELSRDESARLMRFVTERERLALRFARRAP